MYDDRKKLNREEFIKRFINVDPALYKELKDRGYQFYGSSMHNWSDGLCQKLVYAENGDKLFFIDIWCYIYDERFPRAERRVGTSIEAHFYLKDEDDKYCTIRFSSRDLDFCETFFLNFFYNEKCRIYEKAN